MPHRKGTKIIMHFNRTVIHPDYIGLGLGVKLINASAKHLLSIMDCRIMGKFSSVPMYKALKKDDNWILKEERMKLNTQITGGNMKRHINAGFRDRGIKTWTFEYIGNKKQ